MADYVEWREFLSTFPESEDARLDPTASSLYLSMVLGGELDESESPRIEGLLLAPMRNEFAADSRWLANRDGVCREGVRPNPSHGMAAKRAIRTDALNILSVGPALSPPRPKWVEEKISSYDAPPPQVVMNRLEFGN